ncbi:GGDEF domain-containing protein [Thermosipho ferrireducens]|uniref:GGDEF domain-containing protein n=1 Tax=Thermosipho ferrireducens TaxID=2571116 RepID=A0ABX7S6B2_9BACT|nr:GGDEF domain-containing protein [Thermosipho ferrireducens]QTA37724.1 GGDEF domain-containing protein [Thermosipho ferrireducens]
MTEFLLAIIVFMALLIFYLFRRLKLRTQRKKDNQMYDELFLIFHEIFRKIELGIGVWKRCKLVYKNDVFDEFLKTIEVDTKDFENAQEFVESWERLFEKYPKFKLLEDVLDTIKGNLDSNDVSLNWIREIDKTAFMINFTRFMLGKDLYTTVNIKNITQEFTGAQLKTAEVFSSVVTNVIPLVLENRQMREIGKAIYNNLYSAKVIDSFIIGTIDKRGEITVRFGIVGNKEISGLKVPKEEKTLLRYFIDKGKPEYFSNILKVNLTNGYKPKIIVKKDYSIYGVPISFRGDVFGAVLFEKSGENLFSPATFPVFEHLANIIAITLKLKEYYDIALKERDRYYNMSIKDTMTGAYNRAFLVEYLIKMHARIKRKPEKLCIVFIDIDDFKSMNDKYGHLFGDRVLKDFVRITQKNIRTMDFVVRYGGDEFILLLPTINSKEAEKIVSRLKKKLSSLEFPIKFSYGIVEFDPDVSVEDNLRKVDEKMYEMKNRKPR